MTLPMILPKKCLFQKRKRGLAQKFFIKGLNASVFILLALKEGGEAFLEELPDCYSQFKLTKKVFGVGKYKNGRPPIKRETIVVNLHRLKKEGLIAKDPKKKIFYLTEKGKEAVIYIQDRYSILKNPWDGKLRIIIFDIPEKKKEWRRWLRQELALLQFFQLQKSVYIGKHPLPESFYKEICEADIEQFIFILTVGEIDKKKEVLRMIANLRH